MIAQIIFSWMFMLSALQIGPKRFATNLIQAPLAGVSCAPFRELVWHFGGVAYCCTEMLSAQHIAKNSDRSPRYQFVSRQEGALCWQLSGNDPDYLARASARAVETGAAILDLNCGCPQPKIRKKTCGSRLLEDEKRLAALVRAMRQDARIPVTVKMRIDAGHGDFCEVTLAKMLESAGADALIVHGRHWTHDYDIPCQLDSIARIVSAVSIPVIGNGDIHDAASLKHMFEQTKCAGFMIARASVGQPWLFAQLSAQLREESFVPPSLQEIGQLFIRHINGLIKLEGERNAILQGRKFAKYYARSIPDREDFIQQIMQPTDFINFSSIIATYLGVRVD